MLKEERQQLILDILKKESKVIAAELSEKLNVSEDTIRRDLRDLDSAGLIKRVHGGALLSGPPIGNFEERLQQSSETKTSISTAALQLVKNGQVIIIDGGTSNLRLAQQLPEDLQATVVTNSPHIAIALSANKNLDIISLGGQLFKESPVNLGAGTVEELDRIRADLCFLGVYSIHPQIGISIPHHHESFVKRKMISVSTEVAAIVTPEKLGTAAPYIVAPAKALTYLITDRQVSRESIMPYIQQDIAVLQNA